MVSTVFLALALVIVVGSILVYILPDFPVDQVRQNINKLVLYIFLPALNFQVVYSSTIGHEFWQIPVLAALGIIIGVILGVLLYLPLKHPPPRAKASLILACAFGNVTYFGIAVLQGLFPNYLNETIKVVVLFEITITPLGLIIGSILAETYGKEHKISIMSATKDSLLAVVKMPLLWTTFLALALNLLHIPVESFILKGVSLLASTVSGLMILALGMALKFPVLKKSIKKLHILLPVFFIKLLVSPALMLLGTIWLQVSSPYFQAAVIEAAMPSQLISLVIADRFGLDTEILAVAITVDTVLSFFTIPMIQVYLNTHWPIT